MTDVVVVGAGVIGLFCALRLAQRGAHVVVLEGDNEDLSPYAPTASLAAAGMLAPINEASGPPERHTQLDALALASFDLWRTQSRGALWEDGLRFDGGVRLAASAEAAAAFEHAAAALGRSVKPLSSGQWRKRSGFATRLEHALFVEDEGAADPLRVLSGLVMDARRHGVQVLYDHDVDTIEANGVTVYDKGRFDADVVVLAPGAWASETMLSAAPALKYVKPARGHIAPVRLEQPLSPNIHGDGFYLASRGSGDVVLGATMEFGVYERNVDPERIAQLHAAAARALPGEVHLREDARPWVGVRPMSPDWAPIVGKSGVAIVACGHSRNGWLLAPITADMVCAHVFDDPLPPLWAAFTPDRLQG